MHVADQGEQPTVIETSDPSDFLLIRRPHIQAVIYTPHDLPSWFDELGSAVASGAFRVTRTILTGANRKQIEERLQSDLPLELVSRETMAALREDLLLLVDRCADLTGRERFRFRFMTDVPNCDCGFHVDTVPAGVPPYGMVRVYCGAGTEYVDPSNLTSITDFYAFVFRREQATKRLKTGYDNGDPLEYDRALEARRAMDDRPPFLRRWGETLHAPVGSIIAMRHVEATALWSDHIHTRDAMAWIHRSPMSGERRFMASINPV